jgi:hypothetical protein
MKGNHLDHLRIASPCPMNWERMAGDDRVRFCDQCNLHVYNIAALTRREAEALIVKTEGRFCARLYRRVDGTIITKDCPVGLRAMRRRVAKVAGATFAAIVSLCASAAGQKPSAEKKTCQQSPVVKPGVFDSKDEPHSILLIVADPNGAGMPGVKIILATKAGVIAKGETDAFGSFKFSNLKGGSYEIMLEAKHFKSARITQIELGNLVGLKVSAAMELKGVAVTVGGAMADMMSEHLGNRTLDGDVIRRLPFPQ